MKALRAFALAAAVAAFLALITTLIPELTLPALFGYVIVVVLVTAAYDYSRQSKHRLF